VYVVFGSTGSFGVGLLADLFGWGVSYSVLAGLCALAFGAVVCNSVLDLGY
jgi:hypothetical protein